MASFSITITKRRDIGLRFGTLRDSDTGQIPALEDAAQATAGDA